MPLKSKPSNKVRDALLGLAVGDALGVPHEFRPRHELERNPVVGMEGQGTWNQPPGTWSDDSSLSFCLAETLCTGYDLRALADRLVAWLDAGLWTSGGAAFDVGRSTAAAIARLRDGGVHPAQAGLRREQDNGNGSLMRILPAIFHIKGRSAEERAWIVAELSALTHGHRRAQLACIIYTEIALLILGGQGVEAAYRTAAADFSARFAGEAELRHFSRILSLDLGRLDRADIASTGYVVDTLEAALWCLLVSSSYESTVLTAVNLGGDTDTVASVAGGLAGLAYGADSIPAPWLSALARRADIEALADRLAAAYPTPPPRPA